MVNHSYECECGHAFDRLVEWDQRFVACPKCRKKAERTWTLSKARRFSEPVVLHKYADGQWGVPGRADSPTPVGAERVECWNMPDYERALDKMNKSERSRASEKHERAEMLKEEKNQKLRDEIKYRIGQASSEWERDMLRVTLERRESSYRPLQFQEFYNEALEG